MRLSISSFKLVLGFGYAALAMAGGAIILFWATPSGRMKSLSIEPYRFRQLIAHQKPNLVLVGNSYLYENVDPELLSTLLTKQFRRRYRVMLVATGGASPAWRYLAIRNHVLGNSYIPERVGVFFNGYELTRSARITEARQRHFATKLLNGDEPLSFFKKTGLAPLEDASWTSWTQQRWGVSQYFLFSWCNTLLFHGPERRDVRGALLQRFALTHFRPTGSPFTEQEVSQTGILCSDFSDCILPSMLPDLMEVMQQVPSFFVEVHPRPVNPSDPISMDYRKLFKLFLAERNVGFLTLSDAVEVNDVLFYTTGEHLTDKGQILNTHAFAERLIRSNILNSKSPSARVTNVQTLSESDRGGLHR